MIATGGGLAGDLAPDEPQAAADSTVAVAVTVSPGKRWQELLQRRNAKFRSTVHLFGGVDKDVRLIFRHRLNSRRVDQSMRRYKNGILSMGVLDEMRGSLVLIPQGVESLFVDQTYGVIGGGTLFDAIYLAIEEEPSNPHCLDLLKNGVHNTIILDRHTTDDEIELVKQLHNDFHGGQGTTVAELYRQVPATIQTWRTYCTQQAITVNSLPKTGPFCYAQQYAKFVIDQDSSKMLTIWEDYENTKSVLAV